MARRFSAVLPNNSAMAVGNLFAQTGACASFGRMSSARATLRRLLSASGLLAFVLGCRFMFCHIIPSGAFASSLHGLTPRKLASAASHVGSGGARRTECVLRHAKAVRSAPPVAVPLAVNAAATWATRRDQMVLPGARVVTSDGTQGTGFIISNGENGTFVVTNHHVVKDSIKQDDRWDSVEKSSKKIECTLPVRVEIFKYDDRGQHLQTLVTSAEIVAYQQFGNKWDFEGDLALLRLRAPAEGVPSARLIREEDYMDEVRVLDEVVMVGCPEGAPLPLPTTGHIASLTEERAGVGLLLSHVFGNPGSSGSAVYRYSPDRASYEVVAVHSMADSRGSLTDVGRGSFLRLAVPAPTIHKFLKRHGFGWLAAGASGEEEEESEEEGDEESDANASATAANSTATAANTTVGNATDSNSTDVTVTDSNATDGNGTSDAPAADEEPPAADPPAGDPEGSRR